MIEKVLNINLLIRKVHLKIKNWEKLLLVEL